MDLNDIYLGKLLRLFIINQNKSKLTTKKEISAYLKINDVKTEQLIKDAKEYVTVFNLNIIDVEKNKYFITREKNIKLEITSKTREEGDRRMSINEIYEMNNLKMDEIELYTFLSCIQIEHNDLRDIELLKTSSIFRGRNIEQSIKRFINRGYVIRKQDKNENVYQFGWRYYIEYDHFLDIFEYFKLKRV